MKCTSCGRANPKGAKFCNKCGKLLADAPSGASRPSEFANTSKKDAAANISFANTGGGAAATNGGVAAGAQGLAIGGDLLINATKITYTGEDPKSAQSLLNRYLKWVISEFESLPLKAVDPGAARPDRTTLSLAEIYVDLDIDFVLPDRFETLEAYLTYKEDRRSAHLAEENKGDRQLIPDQETHGRADIDDPHVDLVIPNRFEALA
jgi:zinc ribbon protein